CSEDANIGTFKEALATAHHIHNVLTVENASAYFVWGLFWYMKGGLISINPSDNSYRINPAFYAVKQYSGFITPGSRRIYAASGIQKILVSAYLNEADNHVTIIIINESQDTVSMKINLKNVSHSSFKQYRTSKSENCAYVGDITVSNSLLDVTAPPESIITLFG
ncbi:MAG: glycoside hydrolase family 30 beta sandwich domain-containing protein, partial [Candidatus Bathyarchaeia archaeon]